LTRPPVSRPLRLFFKLPVLLYRGWLAELFRWRCVLLVTTTGRKTGRPHTTGLSFLPLNEHYVVFAGWGARSDWYQNALASPAVMLQVGRRRLQATAQPVRDPARRRALMLQMQARSHRCGPPRLLRRLLRLVRLFDYDGEIARAVEQAEALPVVELIPSMAPEQG
jgi:deazaflavin-dependent oxidoreductase (nitroreductase family)